MWLVAAASDSAQWFLGSPLVLLLLLFGWSVALIFHFFSGIQHLAWDAGIGFDASVLQGLGWGILIAAGVCTVLVWALGLVVW